jgi:SAM-dependent methyltransferase
MDAKSRLDELARGFMHSTIVLTACATGIFEVMGRQGWKAQALAERLAVDARALETVLRALASDEIVLCEEGIYRIDPAYAPFLLRGGTQSQTFILNHNYHIMQRWVRLAEVLRTGKPIARADPAADPDEAERQMRDFICGMADISRASSVEVAEKYDLSAHRRMLDLGGGPATAAIVFARANPALHCVVFDLPGPLAIAREQIEAAGLAERIATLAGDYFSDDIGSGYDLIYVSNIIHSMDADETRRLIAKCRRALAPGGVAIVKDFFLEVDCIHPAYAAMFSVNMLIGTEGGRSYTLSEVRAMAQAEGFARFETLEVGISSRLLVCRLST